MHERHRHDQEFADAGPRTLSPESLLSLKESQRQWLRRQRTIPKGASLEVLRLWHEELRLESYGIRRKGRDADDDL